MTHSHRCKAFSCLLFLLASVAVAHAQQSTPDVRPRTAQPSSHTNDPLNTLESMDVIDPSATNPEAPPPLHGINAGITFSGVHDSIVGWSTIATPAVGYSFNDTFSIDATIPIYFYRLAESRSPKPKPTAQLVDQRGEPGDLILGAHAQFLPPLFQYQITAAMTAPSGDEAYGLTTGRCTFDINNQFERTFGRTTANIELGGGDSSTLVNRIVNKNYTSLGPLAHFQAGVSFDLPHSIVFESDAYEQLPIGDQKIYGPSRNGRATVVTGHNVTEDNGFTNSIDLPINAHTSLSAYYNRSLRLHTDTVAFGITYVLRAPPPAPETPLDDLFR